MSNKKIDNKNLAVNSVEEVRVEMLRRAESEEWIKLPIDASMSEEEAFAILKSLQNKVKHPIK